MQTENQLPYFLYMVLCGIGIMLCYDFLRIHRRLSRVPDFIVNLEDFAFSALSALVIFYITYAKNSGEIRWQTAGGLFVGCILYFVLVRNRFVHIGCRILRLFAKIVKKTVMLILAPFLFLLKIILKPTRVIFSYWGRGVKKVGRRAKITGTRAKVKLKIMRHIMRKK